MFDSLDFLVDLARRHRLHVKLDPLQQIFFYKSPYKHLFEYDANINNSKYLNEHFQFKGRPMVYVVPSTDKDQETFKTYKQFPTNYFSIELSKLNILILLQKLSQTFYYYDSFDIQ